MMTPTSTFLPHTDRSDHILPHTAMIDVCSVSARCLLGVAQAACAARAFVYSDGRWHAGQYTTPHIV